MSQLDLKVTDRVMHRKRQSFYTIIAEAAFSPVYLDKDPLTLVSSDGGVALLAKHVNWGRRMNVSIPGIVFQRSSDQAEVYMHPQRAFVYRNDEEGSLIFARPIFEFTEDRFQKVSE